MGRKFIAKGIAVPERVKASNFQNKSKSVNQQFLATLLGKN